MKGDLYEHQGGDMFKKSSDGVDFAVKKIVNDMAVLESQDRRRQILTEVNTLKSGSFYLKRRTEIYETRHSIAPSATLFSSIVRMKPMKEVDLMMTKRLVSNMKKEHKNNYKDLLWVCFGLGGRCSHSLRHPAKEKVGDYGDKSLQPSMCSGSMSAPERFFTSSPLRVVQRG